MKILARIFPFAIAVSFVLVSSCGEEEVDQETGPDLTGSWKTSCETSGSDGKTDLWTFADSSATLRKDHFDGDTTCGSDALAFHYDFSGTYSLSETDEGGDDDFYPFEHDLETGTVTLDNDDAVTTHNLVEACGKSDWASGTAIDVTALTVSSTCPHAFFNPVIGVEVSKDYKINDTTLTIKEGGAERAYTQQ